MQLLFPTPRHTGDVVLQVSGRASGFREYLQTRWRTLHQRYGRGRGFDDFWSDALQHGGVYTDVAVQSPRLVPRVPPRPRGVGPPGKGTGPQPPAVLPPARAHRRPGGDNTALR